MLPFIKFIDDNVYFMHSWASIHADAAGIGIPASSISVRYRSIPVPDGVPVIPVPDWFRHQLFCSFRYRTDWTPESPAFRHLKKHFTKVKRVAFTPRTSTLHAMDWIASCTLTLLVVERGTLHVHTAGRVERDTPTTNTLLVVERDTPCTSILMPVERDAPCTSIPLMLVKGIPTARLNCR